MARRKIAPDVGLAALRAFQGGDTAAKATAVRFLLEELAERIPGNSVEVRVPPYLAVQCVPGPLHKRGTPPNVAELDAETWISLATGKLTFQDALTQSRLSLSGTRASEFAAVLPLIRD